MDAFNWFMVGTLTGLLITYAIVSTIKQNKMLKVYPEQDLINEIKRRRVEAALTAATEKAVEKELE
jgi:hypothetical protein